MLSDHVGYQELGGSYFTPRDPERAAGRAITQLNQLGYTVTLNPRENAARPAVPDTRQPSTAAGHPVLPTPTLTCCYLRVRDPFEALSFTGVAREHLRHGQALVQLSAVPRSKAAT
jgi:hypothetical protein